MAKPIYTRDEMDRYLRENFPVIVRETLTDQQLRDAAEEQHRRDVARQHTRDLKRRATREEAWVVLTTNLFAQFGLAEHSVVTIWEAVDEFKDRWDR